MFANTKAFSSFAVDDISRARDFYSQTLGLQTSEEHGLMTLHLAGERDTLVYPKPDHTPAGYTVLNFTVKDIEEAVDDSQRVVFALSDTTASTMTTGASSAAEARISPGLQILPGTCSRCCSRIDRLREPVWLGRLARQLRGSGWLLLVVCGAVERLAELRHALAQRPRQLR